jgi:hypothetical protein
MCEKHLSRSVQWKGPEKGVYDLRGKYAGYLKGIPDVREFIKRMVVLTDAMSIMEILNEMKIFYKGLKFLMRR